MDCDVGSCALTENSSSVVFGPRRSSVEASMNDDDLVYRLELGLPPQSPEEALAREPYERLIARIGDLELIEPLPGWEDRAVARFRDRRAKR